MTEVEDLLRELAPQVLAPVARRFGNFDDVEDARDGARPRGGDHPLPAFGYIADEVMQNPEAPPQSREVEHLAAW